MRQGEARGGGRGGGKRVKEEARRGVRAKGEGDKRRQEEEEEARGGNRRRRRQDEARGGHSRTPEVKEEEATRHNRKRRRRRQQDARGGNRREQEATGGGANRWTQQDTGETAWKAQICLLTKEDPNEEMNVPEELLNAGTPLVWASKTPRRAINVTPAREGLEPIKSSSLEHGLLRECQSEFNTPILPVKKPHSSESRLVQDLGEIKQGHDIYFTVLDLKDAFFCIPVDEQSQTIFTFEWENPTTGRKTQLCWTVLPQGFKNSPTLFGKVLAKELELYKIIMML
ncbi:hypothetical protein QYF61_017207 [Mycteria americana]|uniref:Reverse transcriptase domain-containing protein n=1 Tax=Mycteria americana TaxID=33587 RepID=A0AAN7MAH5_MYCAM|nr:hypothetical protein QYF61_017207 [Mycteria americana]